MVTGASRPRASVAGRRRGQEDAASAVAGNSTIRAGGGGEIKWHKYHRTGSGDSGAAHADRLQRCRSKGMHP